MCNEPKQTHKAHPHAALMLLYAKDAAEMTRPWTLWEYEDGVNNWCPCTTHPSWVVERKYRHKPRFININGFDVPEPCYNPEPGQKVWWVDMTSRGVGWDLYENRLAHHKARAAAGIAHCTREAAELHVRALLSFTEKPQT